MMLGQRLVETICRSTDKEAVVVRCFSTIFARLARTESCQTLHLPLFNATGQALRMWMGVCRFLLHSGHMSETFHRQRLQ